MRSSTSLLAKILGTYDSNLRKQQFEYITGKKSEFKEFIGGVQERISNFENFYENKVALLEPVSYLRNKKGWHIFGTTISALVFFGYCTALAWFIGKFFVEFDGGVKGFIDFWKIADLSALGAVALLLGLLLILARIFYRILASQLHLWNDASERVTMTQTYLAFAEKGHVKDEHLSAVLARLFAPASDGVVKDDFGSVGPIDALIGRIAK